MSIFDSLTPNLPSGVSGLIPIGIPLVEAAALGLITAIFGRQRIIGVFIPDITIREDHEDELVVTENPVEQGASVTDHSFKVPARLTVDVGYSNSSVQSFGNPNYVQDMYALFLALQASRIPFFVLTGKRIYLSMLITRLHTVTDKDTENVLLLTVSMKEIIQVSTQTVSVPSSNNMTNPQNNGAAVNSGTSQSQFAGGANSAGGTSASSPFNYSGAPFSAGFGQGG